MVLIILGILMIALGIWLIYTNVRHTISLGVYLETGFLPLVCCLIFFGGVFIYGGI